MTKKNKIWFYSIVLMAVFFSMHYAGIGRFLKASETVNVPALITYENFSYSML